MSKYRMEVDVHEPSSYWKVWNAEGTAIADGSAPDEARARACGEAVVAALEGRRILCEGSLIPGALWPLGDAPSGTVQEQRDTARVELKELCERITKLANKWYAEGVESRCVAAIFTLLETD